MNGISFIQNEIEKQILNIRTQYLAKVIGISGKEARLQPLAMYKAAGGKAKKSEPTTAFIPANIKYKTESITYMVSENDTETKTVLVPDNLSVGDIVCVGVCDRDISHAKNGIISESTARHHDVNDGVILRVL